MLTSIVMNPDPDRDTTDIDNKVREEKAAQAAQIAALEANMEVEEKWHQTTIQVSIPFMLAGIGTIGAGVILGHVETWEVFREIPALFILVPALMGLKGNLDMTLASRLSTHANLGNMKTARETAYMVLGNIAIVQVQATVAALVISLFAMAVAGVIEGTFHMEHAFLIIASSMFTANTSCFVLDFVLVGVILLAHKYKANPDNMATPLAASFGDVIAVGLLSLIVSFLYLNIYTHLWITYVIIATFCLLLPIWVVVVLKNTYTRPILKTGWVPVISALIISGLGGLVLMQAVDNFSGFVVFQPIINGIGGNLVSVQASRIATKLHSTAITGVIPPKEKICELPWRAIFHGSAYAKTARILILMSIPGQVLFIFAADFIHQLGSSTIGAPFVFSYLFVSLIQIMLLLYIAHVIIHAMWRFKIDPDTAAIPYLTALGDFFGSTLLLGAFAFLSVVGHGYIGRFDPGESLWGALKVLRF